MINKVLRCSVCVVWVGVSVPVFSADGQLPKAQIGEEPACRSGTIFKPLSLAEAVAVAMSDHPQVLIAELELKKANSQVLAAVTPFLPSASVSMQGERFVTQNPTAQSTSVGSTVVGGQRSQYSSYASLNANWNLFNGGKDLAGYRSAKAGVQASAYDLVRQTNETLSTVLIAYNDLFKAQTALLHQAETSKLLRGVLQRTEKRFEEGVDNQIALSKEKVTFAKSEQGMFQVCQALFDKSAVLARSLGLRLPAGHVFRLDAPIPDVEQMNLNDDDLELIVQDDPGVKAAKERAAMAQHKLDQTRASFYPTVAMTGRYDWLGQDPNSVDVAVSSTSPNSYRFGVVLQQPLGPFTSEYAAVETAHADVLKADALYRQALIDAETKLRTVLDAKIQTELSAKSSQLQTAQTRLTFQQTSQLFKDGYADLDAVSQAQISLSKEQGATDELLADAKLAAWNAYLVLRPDEFAEVLLGINHADPVLTDRGNQPELLSMHPDKLSRE
ncbi:TolC family protein [Methylobacter tundripaludum]|uniref:TolC family protein n=1 Tax=Methylobacter tundripaludum TaxID=173365 RepID=UPI000482C9C5|nr:TolC family protein [Methylobacter tundripaludum]